MYSEAERKRQSGGAMHAKFWPTGTLVRALLSASLLGSAAVGAKPPTHDVIGVAAPQLDADYWIRRDAENGKRLLSEREIEALNARLVGTDPSVNDLAALPREVEAARVRGWIEAISRRPDGALYDTSGAVVTDDVFRALEESLALDAIAASRATQYGLVVRRAPLRAFPTLQRVFNAPDNTNIDRFQENALFPGTPVAVVHESRDGRWLFVISALYEAWIERANVAIGARDAVLGYTRKAPYLVVTGPTVRTVYTPDAPAVSELQLDMGVRVPVLADWPGDRPVNGQHPYTNHVIELPVRTADGTLAFAPALLPRSADVSDDYLPLTRANVLRQGFKFLGERYGWGHDYNARDCSGFVSEVYRSFGVMIPRNTRDQAISPAYDRIAFDEGWSREDRVEVLRELDVGDLVYIPGHVMMVIGQEKDGPYVIHDTTGIGYLDAGGAYKRVTLNGVSVTPLLPLYAGEAMPTIDRITAIQRIRPVDADASK
ncbi:MAG TPA: SH3 domain-containing protein [Candidatus Saccharimonadia bacterium]|nr:SH3 domain-containing protein [Candidatus Saccharimonadia bacterium]